MLTHNTKLEMTVYPVWEILVFVKCWWYGIFHDWNHVTYFFWCCGERFRRDFVCSSVGLQACQTVPDKFIYCFLRWSHFCNDQFRRNWKLEVLVQVILRAFCTGFYYWWCWWIAVSLIKNGDTLWLLQGKFFLSKLIKHYFFQKYSTNWPEYKWFVYYVPLHHAQMHQGSFFQPENK